MTTVFVDSDVILDALLRREPFYLQAINLIEFAHQGIIKLNISSSAFINVHYFLKKSFKSESIKALKQLRVIVNITSVYAEIIDSALNSDFSDFEDAVQYYAAKDAGAMAIITRNIKDYKNATIPVLTAEQFLRTVN